MQNPFEGKKVIFVEDANDPINADGVKGHLDIVGDCNPKKSFYNNVFKRFIDIVLSGLGLIVLLPVYLILIVAIFIDDPGPVFLSKKGLD